MAIQRGQLSQSAEIADLIFASEPSLLSFLFGGQANCRAYLQQACHQAQGQFSAKYHWVYSQQDNSVDGVCATWLAVMPIEFQAGTISALRNFLCEEQIIHLLAYKDMLDDCFVAPTSEQLCIGHLSVHGKYKRKGLARSFIQHAKTQAQTLGLSELILDVDVANKPAINCYLSEGFSHVRESAFEATQQTFSRMSLNLQSTTK